MWQNIGIFVTKLTEFYNPRKQARNEIAVHLSSYLLTVIETIQCGQNGICRDSTFGWSLAGLTLNQIICFIFSILDRWLDRLPANISRKQARGITDGQQSVYCLCGVADGPQSSHRVVWHRSCVECLSKSDSMRAASCPALHSCWWRVHPG